MTFREVALILIVLICNRPSVKLHPNLLLSIQTNFLVKKNMRKQSNISLHLLKNKRRIRPRLGGIDKCLNF